MQLATPKVLKDVASQTEIDEGKEDGIRRIQTAPAEFRTTPDANKEEPSTTTLKNKNDSFSQGKKTSLCEVATQTDLNGSAMQVYVPSDLQRNNSVVTTASSNILRDALRINVSRIALNTPVLLWAASLATLFAGLANRRADHKIGWELAFDSSAWGPNFCLAIFILQRIQSACADFLLHRNDNAYKSIVIVAALFGFIAFIPSLPISNDSTKGLLPNAHPALLYTGDGINGLNTLLTRILGAIVILLLFYQKTAMKKCQPDRYFLKQMRADLLANSRYHPENFESVTIEFARQLYANNLNFNPKTATSIKVAEHIGYVLSLSSLAGGPLVYDFIVRGSRRIVALPVAVSAALTLPTIMFYARFLFLLPTTFLKLSLTLFAEYKKIFEKCAHQVHFSSYYLPALFLTAFPVFFAASTMLLFSAYTLMSGTGLGSEALDLVNQYLKNSTYALVYSLYWTFSAGGVNANGFASLFLEMFQLRDRYKKDFDFTFPQAMLEKFFKCYDVVLTPELCAQFFPDAKPGDRLKIEDAYKQINRISALKEKNNRELDHGVVSPDFNYNAAGALREQAIERSEASQPSARSKSAGFCALVGNCLRNTLFGRDEERRPLTVPTNDDPSLNTIYPADSSNNLRRDESVDALRRTESAYRPFNRF